MLFRLIVAHGLVSFALAQVIHVQNNTFNSSYSLTSSQITASNISITTANNVNIAVNFERTNWATCSVSTDAFYKPPSFNDSTLPGTLLAVEENTPTSLYTLAPNLALSRIIYTSATVNGSTIPVSAHILWPWKAKSFSGSSLNISGVPVVVWAHGTSGVFGECAPSHIRNLWYQFSAPYILALQGYAVVASDYAGLGANTTAEGEPVLHTYLANPAHANDMIFSFMAARKAFPELSKHFVTMGHSQGGGAAWGVAQRQAQEQVEGYLGTVAGSPVTDIIANAKTNPSTQWRLAWRIAQGLGTIYRSFRPEEWLQPDGVKRLSLIQELQGCNSVDAYLFDQPNGQGLVKPGWEDTWYANAYRDLTSNGGKPIANPMLVLQGTVDPAVNPNVTTSAVNETCELFPKSQIHYAMFEGATHVPVLNAGQQVWLKWIEGRFMGLPVEARCKSELFRPLRDIGAYQKELEYYLQLALEPYEVA